MEHEQSLHELLKKIEQTGSKKIKVAITDLDGVMRGKLIHIDKLKSALEKGFGFCNVVFGWDCSDVCYDQSHYSGWDTGFPDAMVKLVPQTFRKIPWDHQIPFLLGEFIQDDENSLPYCPRGVLKKVIKSSQELGFNPMFGCEFEWFNFKETAQTINEKQYRNPTPLTPGMFGYSLLRSGNNRSYFNDLMDLLEEFRVPLEGLHTETGPGVYEAAIKYSDALEAADRASLFKMATKEIASHYGIIPSFMARWNGELPGCSGHIHQSLSDEHGVNKFFDASKNLGMSDIFKQYMAGLIKYVPELLVLMAPTINSYKRLVKGFWAPTSPTWGIDNRTCAFRALVNQGASSRIEVRVPGSDANPYLSIAASLAAGLAGIKNELDLEEEAIKGNAYEKLNQTHFSSNLYDAAKVFEKSDFAHEVFGSDFVSHYVGTRVWEWEQYQKHISDWEMKRYFEII